MPFEPLRTDEPIAGPKAKVRDFDSQMIAGCSGFVATSVITYGLAVAPHFAFVDTYRLNVLILACAAGMIPAWLWGGFATRKFGLAGAAGFVGGSLAAAIFFLLNLKRILLREGLKDLPQPEFPASWQYLVPGVFLLCTFLVVAFTLRRDEFMTEADMCSEDSKPTG